MKLPELAPGFLYIQNSQKPGDYLVLHQRDFVEGVHTHYEPPAETPVAIVKERYASAATVEKAATAADAAFADTITAAVDAAPPAVAPAPADSASFDSTKQFPKRSKR
jgi:hypothetical protein